MLDHGSLVLTSNFDGNLNPTLENNLMKGVLCYDQKIGPKRGLDEGHAKSVEMRRTIRKFRIGLLTFLDQGNIQYNHYSL